MINDKYSGMGCDCNFFSCPDGPDYAADAGISTAARVIPDEIRKRIESREIIEQKCWKFIKELNSYSDERLDAVALVDGRRQYTYRQMFRKWKRYARVFSTLGMTGKEHARVAVRGTPAAEIILALFALNMTGASVSISLMRSANNIDGLRGMDQNENITDIILPDYDLSKKYLKQLMEEKDELGIRNVIVIHIPVFGEFANPFEEMFALMKYDELKSIQGVLFMDELLKKYKNEDIVYAQTECDDAAMIAHTSGTTTGASKPVPLSDRGINETSARLLADSRFESLYGRASAFLAAELGSAYALCDELVLPLAFGGRIAVMSTGGFNIDTLRAISYYRVNVLFGGPVIMEMLMKLPYRPDLSDLEFIFLGGSYASADARNRYNRYLKRCGSKARVTIGYGLSEAGGACIISSSDREDDAIGRPVDGIKIRLFDEESGRFLDPADGPAEGIMYISSPSVSSGKLGDKTIFELEEIEGEKYLNTFDYVKTDEEGVFYYAGRMNKFFVNNDNVRFDAGLVENAVSAQPKIESCGLVPGYSKRIRDTIPVLYVKATLPADSAKHAVINALRGAFITDGVIKESNLPLECVITDDIPYNASGKVDNHQIVTGDVEGYRYNVIPVRRDGVLKDIRLVTHSRSVFAETGLPEELDTE